MVQQAQYWSLVYIEGPHMYVAKGVSETVVSPASNNFDKKMIDQWIFWGNHGPQWVPQWKQHDDDLLDMEYDENVYSLLVLCFIVYSMYNYWFIYNYTHYVHMIICTIVHLYLLFCLDIWLLHGVDVNMWHYLNTFIFEV